MPQRRVSMDDIARHLGLSRSTVSFVINDRTDIRIADETKRRVWDAVEELGYRPHAAARSLASSRTNLLGLVTDIASSPFGGGIITGAQRAAWARGQVLLIVSIDQDASADTAMLEMLLERRIEGLIYATAGHISVSLPAAASEVPVVLVHCEDADGRYPSILPDEEHGGYTATRRLIEGGRRRIGLLNLDAPLPSAGRRRGYERALREAGIAVDPALVAQGPADAASGFELATAMLRRVDPPDALFCGTDRMAMGAFDAAREAGMRIPDDIRVVGYDDQEIVAAYLRPALTTVALPFEEMGAAAVEALNGDMDTFAGAVLRGTLVERSSA
ncbi:LacI family DNA-binding transcriptional regulator [Microbacterium sp. RG1]|uniref:LacI family DNA-binding transcriptional regulator n=1 Tax=Microbacterium sp. RG1 TaxID=2489212 RepID=UPI0010CA4882|nr:LacI family DNA-binding transcriptional regulator [Microbacterium sp. RG1]QCQ17536.1 LacI family DNA-binding transcriptional regulator [Microbacterium sp. RG1]